MGLAGSIRLASYRVKFIETGLVSSAGSKSEFLILGASSIALLALHRRDRVIICLRDLRLMTSGAGQGHQVTLVVSSLVRGCCDAAL